MTDLRIIRAGSLPEIAWKNGGGTTREIAIFPADADMHDFGWRLSMATVETASVFSIFPGVDRTLAVLEGALQLSGPTFAIALDEAAAPFSFAGDATIDATPVAGPVLDINAMVRRGRFRAGVKRLTAGEQPVCAGPTFLVALEPQRWRSAWLARLDIAEIDGKSTVSGRCLIVTFARERHT